MQLTFQVNGMHGMLRQPGIQGHYVCACMPGGKNGFAVWILDNPIHVVVPQVVFDGQDGPILIDQNGSTVLDLTGSDEFVHSGCAYV